MQCRNCEVVFIGSTEWMDDPDQPHSGPESAPPRGHRSTSAPAPFPGRQIAVTAGCAAGIILAILLVWYYQGTKRLQVRGPDGELVFDKRVNKEEADRIIKELQERYDAREAEPVDQSPPEGQGRERGEAGSRRREAPDLMPGGNAPKPAKTIVEPSRARWGQARTDPKIDVTVNRTPFQDSSSGHLIGTATNNHDYPLRRLDISVRVLTSDHQQIRTLRTSCQYVPPGATVPFSIPYANLPPDQAYRLVPIAAGERAERGEVYRRIDPSDCRREVRGKIIRITGKVRNPASRAVKDVRIHCDFFTVRGVYAGSAAGGLEGERTSIPSREWGFFAVEFDTTGTRLLPQVIERFLPCLIAREP